MKLRRVALFCALTLLLSAVGYASHQYRSARFQADPDEETAPWNELMALELDTETWHVFNPKASPAQLAELNAVERRIERAKAAQAILHPRKFNDHSGKKPDEIRVEKLAEFAITHPGLQAPGQFETEAVERARQSILHPKSRRP